MQNITITRKEEKPIREKSDKDIIPLPTVKAMLLVGLDKGGEPGAMMPWARLSRADRGIGSLKEYLLALAKDIQAVAERMPS